jgi:hypothetical protein
MRQHLRNAIPRSRPFRLLPPQDDETPRIVSIALTAQGSAAASWLVRKHRAIFKRDGVMDFRMPRAFLLSKKMRDEKLRWFFVAVARFRRCPLEKWSVARFEQNGQVVYRVTWELRGAYSASTRA